MLLCATLYVSIREVMRERSPLILFIKRVDSMLHVVVITKNKSWIF